MDLSRKYFGLNAFGGYFYLVSPLLMQIISTLRGPNQIELDHNGRREDSKLAMGLRNPAVQVHSRVHDVRRCQVIRSTHARDGQAP